MAFKINPTKVGSRGVVMVETIDVNGVVTSATKPKNNHWLNGAVAKMVQYGSGGPGGIVKVGGDDSDDTDTARTGILYSVKSSQYNSWYLVQDTNITSKDFKYSSDYKRCSWKVVYVAMFIPGAFAGTIREIGIGDGDKNDFTSTRIVLDTPVTPGPTEQVRVTYTFYNYLELGEPQQVPVLINGATVMITVTPKWGRTTGSGWENLAAFGGDIRASSKVLPHGVAMDAQSVSPSSNIVRTFDAATFKHTLKTYLPATYGNYAGGVVTLGDTYNDSIYRFELSPPIPKTSEDVLYLSFTHDYSGLLDTSEVVVPPDVPIAPIDPTKIANELGFISESNSRTDIQGTLIPKDTHPIFDSMYDDGILVTRNTITKYEPLSELGGDSFMYLGVTVQPFEDVGMTYNSQSEGANIVSVMNGDTVVGKLEMAKDDRVENSFMYYYRSVIDSTGYGYNRLDWADVASPPNEQLTPTYPSTLVNVSGNKLVMLSHLNGNGATWHILDKSTQKWVGDPRLDIRVSRPADAILRPNGDLWVVDMLKAKIAVFDGTTLIGEELPVLKGFITLDGMVQPSAITTVLNGGVEHVLISTTALSSGTIRMIPISKFVVDGTVVLTDAVKSWTTHGNNCGFVKHQSNLYFSVQTLTGSPMVGIYSNENAAVILKLDNVDNYVTTSPGGVPFAFELLKAGATYGIQCMDIDVDGTVWMACDGAYAPKSWYTHTKIAKGHLGLKCKPQRIEVELKAGVLNMWFDGKQTQENRVFKATGITGIEIGMAPTSSNTIPSVCSRKNLVVQRLMPHSLSRGYFGSHLPLNPPTTVSLPVVNGDFANGTTGWTTSEGTAKVELLADPAPVHIRKRKSLYWIGPKGRTYQDVTLPSAPGTAKDTVVVEWEQCSIDSLDKGTVALSALDSAGNVLYTTESLEATYPAMATVKRQYGGNVAFQRRYESMLLPTGTVKIRISILGLLVKGAANKTSLHAFFGDVKARYHKYNPSYQRPEKIVEVIEVEETPSESSTNRPTAPTEPVAFITKGFAPMVDVVGDNLGNLIPRFGEGVDYAGLTDEGIVAGRVTPISAYPYDGFKGGTTKHVEATVYPYEDFGLSVKGSAADVNVLALGVLDTPNVGIMLSSDNENLRSCYVGAKNYSTNVTEIIARGDWTRKAFYDSRGLWQHKVLSTVQKLDESHVVTIRHTNGSGGMWDVFNVDTNTWVKDSWWDPNVAYPADSLLTKDGQLWVQDWNQNRIVVYDAASVLTPGDPTRLGVIALSGYQGAAGLTLFTYKGIEYVIMALYNSSSALYMMIPKAKFVIGGTVTSSDILYRWQGPTTNQGMMVHEDTLYVSTNNYALPDNSIANTSTGTFQRLTNLTEYIDSNYNSPAAIMPFTPFKPGPSYRCKAFTIMDDGTVYIATDGLTAKATPESWVGLWKGTVNSKPLPRKYSVSVVGTTATLSVDNVAVHTTTLSAGVAADIDSVIMGGATSRTSSTQAGASYKNLYVGNAVPSKAESIEYAEYDIVDYVSKTSLIVDGVFKNGLASWTLTGSSAVPEVVSPTVKHAKGYKAVTFVGAVGSLTQKYDLPTATTNELDRVVCQYEMNTLKGSSKAQIYISALAADGSQLSTTANTDPLVDYRTTVTRSSLDTAYVRKFDFTRLPIGTKSIVFNISAINPEGSDRVYVTNVKADYYKY